VERRSRDGDNRSGRNGLSFNCDHRSISRFEIVSSFGKGNCSASSLPNDRPTTAHSSGHIQLCRLHHISVTWPHDYQPPFNAERAQRCPNGEASRGIQSQGSERPKRSTANSASKHIHLPFSVTKNWCAARMFWRYASTRLIHR
jgi:hypothetical protein